MPTVEEMGEVITKINVGGVKGLRGIGYLKGIDEPTQKQVTDALQNVCVSGH